MKVALSIFCCIAAYRGSYMRSSNYDFSFANKIFQKTKMQEKNQLKALGIREKQ